jgi:hypothetical protein
MVPFEVSIAIPNHMADWHLVLLNNCRHRPPFEKPAPSGPRRSSRSCGLLRAMGYRLISPIASPPALVAKSQFRMLLVGLV